MARVRRCAGVGSRRGGGEVSQIDRAVEAMKRLEVLVPEHRFRAALRLVFNPDDVKED